MRRCPTCNRTYPDGLRFCPQDGAALASVEPASFTSTPGQSAQTPGGSKNKKYALFGCLGLVGLLFACALLGFLGSLFNKNQPSNSPVNRAATPPIAGNQQSPVPTATPSPAAKATPANAIAPELLRYLLPELNYSLQNKNPLRRATLERGTLTIEFNLATPSASDTIRGLREVGAQDDTRDILAWARNVKLDFNTLVIKGWYEVPDTTGNVTDMVVLEALYRRSVIDEIDFSNISLDSVWSRAFRLKTHPILKS